MNRIDFTKTGGIEVSQDLLDFLQQSYTKLFAGIAALVGNNVIVAGVTDQGSTYSDGWVVVAGELLPFTGGLKAANIIINETIVQENYEDGTPKDAYYIRVAQCASSGGTAVTSFFRLSSLTQLVTSSQLTTAINNLIAAAPGALDTLKELADSIADDPHFATTMINALSGKVAKDGSIAMTGNLDVNSHKVINLTPGSSGTDAVNKNQLDAESTARSGADSAEATARAAGDAAEASARANADNTLQTNINAKADDHSTNWTNITLANGWASGGRTPQWRKDVTGKIHLRGTLSGASASSGTFSTTMPAVSQQSDLLAWNSSGFTLIDLTATGTNLSVNNVGSGATTYLDGISYWP